VEDALAAGVDVALDRAIGIRRGRAEGPVEAHAAAPVPRHDEGAGPDAAPGIPSLFLRRRVDPIAVTRPIECPALPHQPVVDVAAVGADAGGDHALPAVGIGPGAGRRPCGCEEVVEREGGPSAAGPGSVVAATAVLAGLRRIEAVQADAVAAYLDGVAIDDDSAPRQGVG